MKPPGTAPPANPPSREAATAPSCGRKPADRSPNPNEPSREAATAGWRVLPPLRGLTVGKFGVTHGDQPTVGARPWATCCRRFAANQQFCAPAPGAHAPGYLLPPLRGSALMYTQMPFAPSTNPAAKRPRHVAAGVSPQITQPNRIQPRSGDSNGGVPWAVSHS